MSRRKKPQPDLFAGEPLTCPVCGYRGEDLTEWMDGFDVIGADEGFVFCNRTVREPGYVAVCGCEFHATTGKEHASPTS